MEFHLWELRCFFAKRQNEIQESALRQTYRPLGRLAIKDSAKVEYQDQKTQGLIISIMDSIYNKGSGTLIYVGSIACFSPNHINLKEELLAGSFDNKAIPVTVQKSKNIIQSYTVDTFISHRINLTRIVFDGYFNQARLIPLEFNEPLEVLVTWIGDSNREYYLYCLYLYKDIDGNLYDTLRRYYVKTQDQQQNNLFIISQVYGSYTKKEQDKLSIILKPMNPSIAQAVARNPIKITTLDDNKRIWLVSVFGGIWAKVRGKW